MVVFENSAHCAHFEETEAYLATVGEFLTKNEDGNNQLGQP
jgi:hypothetical protein